MNTASRDSEARRSSSLKRWALRWHRSLAWLGGAALLAWGLSGLLHPFMTTFGPQQAVYYPPRHDLDLSAAKPLSATLAEAGVRHARALRIVAGPDNTSLLQITQDPMAPRRYFELTSGSELPLQDREQAIFLARHYLGERTASANLKAIEFLTDFSPDYPPVNRLLPVYRVDFDTPDALSAFVYTETGVLAGVNNRLKNRLQTLFRWLHTWDFMPAGAEWLRLSVIALLVGSLLALALSGLGLLLSIRRKKMAPGARGWHRIAGYALALPLAMLAGSGLFHLIQYGGATAPQNLRLSAPLDLRDLQLDLGAAWSALNEDSSINALSLVATQQGTLLYRLGLAADPRSAPQGARAIRDARFDGIQPTGPALYLEADSGKAWAPGDRELAMQMGSHFTALPRSAIEDARLITRFGAGYDFRNKRLPVWALDYGEPLNSTLFIDTTTGVLADIAAHSARAEQWSFSLLHKWTFLRPLGRDGQNSIIALVVFCAVILSGVLGLILRWRRR